MPGLYDSLVNLGTAVFDATKGFARYRAANVAMAKTLADNYGGVNQLNRGLDEYIGQQENLLDAYSKQMNATLVLEKRNKALQESFGINSVAAAQLSRTLMKMQEVVGGTQEQMSEYAGNIKKMLPLYTQFNKQNDGQYRSMLRIQQVITTNMQLTAAQAEAYTLYTSKAGESAETYLMLGEKLKEVLSTKMGVDKDVLDTTDYMRQIVDGIAEAGSEVQLQYGKLPGNLEIATLKAKALGFSLDDLAGSGEQLLNIESSIGDELEYQLLSGRRLVDQQSGESLTNMYRQATLMGDMSKQADVLNSILETEGETLENNLFARQQMSKLLGIDEAQLSKALQKKKLLESDSGLKVLMNLEGTELQAAVEEMKKQGKLTDQQYSELQKQSDVRQTDDILKQQLTLQFEQTAILKTMLTEEQEAMVKANRDKILDDKALKAVSDSLVTFGGNMEEATDTFQARGAVDEAISTSTGGAKVLAGVTDTTLASSDIMTTTAAAPNPSFKRDVMIPPGGGSAIVSAPAGTFVLDPQDTILAGTDPSLQNPTTVNDINNNTATTVNNINNNTPATGDNLSAVMMQVGRMIVAAINSKGSGVFGATTLNGPYYEG